MTTPRSNADIPLVFFVGNKDEFVAHYNSQLSMLDSKDELVKITQTLLDLLKKQIPTRDTDKQQDQYKIIQSMHTKIGITIDAYLDNSKRAGQDEILKEKISGCQTEIAALQEQGYKFPNFNQDLEGFFQTFMAIRTALLEKLNASHVASMELVLDKIFTPKLEPQQVEKKMNTAKPVSSSSVVASAARTEPVYRVESKSESSLIGVEIPSSLSDISREAKKIHRDIKKIDAMEKGSFSTRVVKFFKPKKKLPLIESEVNEKEELTMDAIKTTLMTYLNKAIEYQKGKGSKSIDHHRTKVINVLEKYQERISKIKELPVLEKFVEEAIKETDSKSFSAVKGFHDQLKLVEKELTQVDRPVLR